MRGPTIGVHSGGQTREGTLAAAQNPQPPYAEEMEEHLPSAEGLSVEHRGCEL